MKFRFYFILTFVLPAFAIAEDSVDKANAIWLRPLKSEYQNLDFPYEAVIRVVECLPDYLEIENPEAEAIANACIKANLNQKTLKGYQDLDRNAYMRSLLEGPPKEGPFTYIRVVRVGSTKSLLQIESVKWHVIFGNSELPELADKRLGEIKIKLKNVKN